ncbi:RNA polymerase II [Hypoxylon rubiginosum]|uniref:RNA polymerase II n=1 Tax=Hypoxylon rubiginosum TaxID=110542 RepID=A0ACC0DJ80_9PEZI|nr:RNA polymerase II [Hypoxylon rubiginosum]
MKILEAQSAVLTNVEVYTFLNDQEKQYQKQDRKGPANLETLRKEVLEYFAEPPGPLSQKPQPFDAAAIPVLFKKLRGYQISKGEFIMLFNVRPANVAVLNTVIEDMEERFSEENQEEILNIIAETLGQFPPKEDNDEEDGAE